MRKERIIERKVYKRRRMRKNIHKGNIAQPGVFPRSCIRIHTNLISFFRRKGFISSTYVCSDRTVLVPKIFSFEKNSDNSITFFKYLLSTFLLADNNVVIDFSICDTIDVTNGVLLKIINAELVQTVERFNSTFYHQVNKHIKLKRSNNDKINRFLYAFKISDRIDNVGDVSPEDGFLHMGLITNSVRKTWYKENMKGRTATKVIDFINDSLYQSEAILKQKGERFIQKMLSEIFNNAEDHSIHNEWYVDGITFKEIVDKEPIIELNLGILNLGFSISEGIYKNEQKNIKMMDNIHKWYTVHEKILKKRPMSSLKKDDLYTLYSLQDGVSRLKYEDESRGHGTMNFIRAFISLGSFGKENPKYKPHLNIISGNTCVHCNNEVEPYLKDNNYYLSLNKENDIGLLPEEDFLKHTQQYFPGTFLEVKIYLNKEYIKKELNKNDGNN